MTLTSYQSFTNIYYVLASIEGMADSYAIKQVNTNDDLKIDSKLFEFDIDGTTILYIGLDRRDINLVSRVDFMFYEYRTKINKDVYKIKLIDALERLAYGCDVKFTNLPSTQKMLDSAIELGRKKYLSFVNPTEIKDAEAKTKVLSAFKALDGEWLSYWMKIYERLLAFNYKNPKPQKKNYLRDGLSAVVFGKFNETDYLSDYKNYRNKSNWLINKLAEESQSLNVQFDAPCPNECERLVSFFVRFETNNNTQYYYIEDDFPFGIYKLIEDITGRCSECGGFSITYTKNPEDNENMTCIFNNWQPELVFDTLKRKIEIINQHIEDKLYGSD